jgi:hypothetical protein
MNVVPVKAWWSIAACCVVVLACSSSRKDRREPDASIADAGDRRLPDETAGVGCKRDSDCPNGRCAKMLAITSSDDATEAPGGYCTAECTNDFECGRSGECSVRANETQGECLGSCDEPADCREGYTCVGTGTLAGSKLSGTCQPLPKTGKLGDRVAGRTCEEDADCEGGSCAPASPLGKPFPGNYCTGRCLEDSDCGAGGACLVARASADAGYCYERCESDLDCARRGYRCVEVGAEFFACFPAPETLDDGVSGKSCSEDVDCGSGASCAKELPFGSLSAYEVVPAPGGYCTQECSRDLECGAGGQCISRGLQGGMCLGNCDAMSDCRDGYSCIPHGRNGDDGKQVCIPLIIDI